MNNDLNNKITDLTLTVVNSDKSINEIKKEKDELSFKLKQLIEGRIVVFKYVENKWKDIGDDSQCCDNNCVNTDNPNGFCREGNGFIRIKSKTEIVYINCMENGENEFTIVESENYFNKPIDEFIQTFTLYYYEIKLIFEKNEWIDFGLRNGNNNYYLVPNDKLICNSFQDNLNCISLPSFNYKTNDIIGCGLVYPPPKITNKLPYIFFTQNGKQIGWPCCENKCVSTERPKAYCIQGNGFGQIESDKKIEYINCRGNDIIIMSENLFNKPITNSNVSQCFLDCITYSLFYFEVKFKFENNEWTTIGLRTENDKHIINLSPKKKLIYYLFQNNKKFINIPSFNYKTNDIIGCGLVYPPPKITNKLPYVFFTKNGKQIGEAILLKGEFESFKPFVGLKCCSVEANYGDNPFSYDVSRHYVLEVFYEEREFLNEN
ncbi:hypothetical protein Mgra_00006838 [Meloidogyne graminicola]|uniref:SPRY domain-containing protein n=1 Tax=Meloidogyne graminicola TaxID=189291 RepID=A0A8S9ZKD7_9BILA|nr:hypothetical protein Mgra_00006838 [Meloidogyne graminicola]